GLYLAFDWQRELEIARMPESAKKVRTSRYWLFDEAHVVAVVIAAIETATNELGGAVVALRLLFIVTAVRHLLVVWEPFSVVSVMKATANWVGVMIIEASPSAWGLVAAVVVVLVAWGSCVGFLERRAPNSV